MDPKEFYRLKAFYLGQILEHIGHAKRELANMSDLEERAPDPNQGEFYTMNTALDEATAEARYLLDLVGPLATSNS